MARTSLAARQEVLPGVYEEALIAPNSLLSDVTESADGEGRENVGNRDCSERGLGKCLAR